MKRAILFVLPTFLLISFAIRFETTYQKGYVDLVLQIEAEQQSIYQIARQTDFSNTADKITFQKELKKARSLLKAGDFWLRYFDPVQYLGINGQLPVEWETEVFEKFEKPYRRIGGGISLVELELQESNPRKDSILHYLQRSIESSRAYLADSNTRQILRPEHFFYANRLYLLNLASIYSTGFESPDKQQMIPELKAMMHAVRRIYTLHDESYSGSRLSADYLKAYDEALAFVDAQPDDYILFDHFRFIRNQVNPLFGINQALIRKYGFYSRSLVDYTLSDSVSSIFDKNLFAGQDKQGIYAFVDDKQVLEKIRQVGELLFFDPILSGNLERSCASCHRPSMYFTDTSRATSLLMDHKTGHERNAPTLFNVMYNHLLMQDGKHFSLEEQGRVVMTNPSEMKGAEKEILSAVMSCAIYKEAFKSWLKYTPEEKTVGLNHIASALTVYLSSFSGYYSAFDDAMNSAAKAGPEMISGFNVFMGKANCGSCHFIPQFNGVKPPYINSEFEVLGVPTDTTFTSLSSDSGRYRVSPVPEMLDAFRTPGIRNIYHTAPYMHNGVFKSLEAVVDFYDKGGGVGHGLLVPSQTLSSDSLHLTSAEIKSLLTFMRSLDERVPPVAVPETLPLSSKKSLNKRVVGGTY